MSHCPRWYLPRLVYEVTIRTLHGTFWLRPDPECAAIVAGAFGHALRRYPGVRLHGFDAQSNHLHYLVSATEPAQLPLFFGLVHSNIARQLNQLRRRTGVFWSRRGKVIPVLDTDAQLDRLTYLLSQGPKSHLVASPTDWPGACSTPGLLGDMTVPARYKGLDTCRRNRLRRTPRPEAELEEDVQITLSPLPALEMLAPDELRAVHAALVAKIEADHAGEQVMGAQRLAEQDPEARPENFVPSPAPRCHAWAESVRRRFSQVLPGLPRSLPQRRQPRPPAPRRQARRRHGRVPARRHDPRPLAQARPRRPRRRLAPRHRRPRRLRGPLLTRPAASPLR
jgi:hypothetical protein